MVYNHSMHSPNSSSALKKPPFAVFLSAAVIIFFSSLSVADSIGFVPCYVDDTECGSREAVSLSNLPELGEEPAPILGAEATPVLPERIMSSAIDLDLPVQDSDTRDIEVLYTMLEDGPVRYVDSARLGEEGNVLIFGHSTSLPIVRNKMYKAFNRVSELKEGDTISVSGSGKTFVYSVTSIASVDVSVGVIDMSKERGKRLTLVTCDTLTGETARFVVEAALIGSY